MFYRIIIILLFLAQFVACKKIDERVSASNQIERIASYLAGKTEPFTVYNDVYRVKTNTVDNSNNAALSVGDSIYISFAQYIFKTAPDVLFNTNIKPVAEGGAIYNESVPYEPLGLVYGESKIIPGLEIGLRNSIVNDSLMLYFTSDNAYKDKANGIVPPNSAIMMFVNVNKIVKK